MSMQSQDIIWRSGTSSLTPAPRVRDHKAEVAKLIDVSTCIGCKACQVACNEWNDLRDEVGHNVGVYDNPADLSPDTWTLMRFDEVETEDDKLEWLIRKDGCMHCAEPGCLTACPQPGAIIQYANGIVDFVSDQCIGCGYCVAGCPFDVPRISKKDNKAYKCTLCADRIAVGQEPACVKTCPTGAISFGSKEDMLHLANERVVELQGRGFAGAGVYDPQGVGGTHVMYVLQHADKPNLYHKLPTDPRISKAVYGWKSWMKPVAAAAFFATLAGTIFHYVGVGPLTTDDEEDDGPSKVVKVSGSNAPVVVEVETTSGATASGVVEVTPVATIKAPVVVEVAATSVVKAPVVLEVEAQSAVKAPVVKVEPKPNNDEEESV